MNNHVKLYWLVNHLINYIGDGNQYTEFYWSREPYEKDFFICKEFDDFWEENKTELLECRVTLIVIREDHVKVYLKRCINND